jgi:hypothetical protein
MFADDSFHPLQKTTIEPVNSIKESLGDAGFFFMVNALRQGANIVGVNADLLGPASQVRGARASAPLNEDTDENKAEGDVLHLTASSIVCDYCFAVSDNRFVACSRCSLSCICLSCRQGDQKPFVCYRHEEDPTALPLRALPGCKLPVAAKSTIQLAIVTETSHRKLQALVRVYLATEMSAMGLKGLNVLVTTDLDAAVAANPRVILLFLHTQHEEHSDELHPGDPVPLISHLICEAPHLTHVIIATCLTWNKEQTNAVNACIQSLDQADLLTFFVPRLNPFEPSFLSPVLASAMLMTTTLDRVCSASVFHMVHCLWAACLRLPSSASAWVVQHNVVVFPRDERLKYGPIVLAYEHVDSNSRKCPCCASAVGYKGKQGQMPHQNLLRYRCRGCDLFTQGFKHA